MGAGHSHDTGHAGGKHRWRLTLAFGLVATIFVVELTYALISGSLALLSDAGHMAADVVALGATYIPNGLRDWLLPTSLFLTVFISGGIIALGEQGWRGFGVGLICGVLLVVLLGFLWTFAYFTSLGS